MTDIIDGFPCGSAGEESTCNAGDLGSIRGLGRSPGEGKGYPLQYSGLENSMDCIVHGVTESRTRLSDLHYPCQPGFMGSSPGCAGWSWGVDQHPSAPSILRASVSTVGNLVCYLFGSILYFSVENQNLSFRRRAKNIFKVGIGSCTQVLLPGGGVVMRREVAEEADTDRKRKVLRSIWARGPESVQF